MSHGEGTFWEDLSSEEKRGSPGEDISNYASK